MRAAGSLALLAGLVLAGCSAPTASDAFDLDATTIPLGPLVTGAGKTIPAAQGLLWDGPELWVDGERQHRLTFDWWIPEGYWDANPGSVEVSIAWNTREGISYDFVRPNNRLNLRIEDTSGRVLAKQGGLNDALAIFGLPRLPVSEDRLPQSSFTDPYSITFLLPSLPSDTYVAVVSVYEGRAAYQGIVQLELDPPREPLRELLPNIVTLPPLDVVIDYPPLWDTADPDLSAAGVRGCSVEEFVFKTQPRRCLRFSNGIGNAGPGPFIVAMKEPPTGAVAQEKPMFQYVERTDGTFRSKPAGSGQFHAHHLHTHYLPISEFALHKYDLDSGARGDRVSQVVKNGFAPLDEGLLQLGLSATKTPGSCFNGVPAEAQWILCISSNWYDLYELDRYENYIEITGVPDGVYELVSTSNPQKLLDETNLEDNEGSAVLRLTGDRVEVLERKWGLPGEPALR